MFQFPKRGKEGLGVESKASRTRQRDKVTAARVEQTSIGARQGKARQGKARQGKARQGSVTRWVGRAASQWQGVKGRMTAEW